MRYHWNYPSPLGELLLESDGVSLTGLWMDRSPDPGSSADGEIPALEKTVAWLDSYFRGEVPEHLPPLAPRGTPFQRLIWDLLLQVPYGATCTYGDLAKQAAAAMGREKMSSQAVGGAAQRNPISIIIPCHRCVGANGSLTGYAYGLERKRWLLCHEGRKGEENDCQ